MQDFVDALADVIIRNESKRLDNIMKYVAEQIQKDVVGVTYAILDNYYQDYMPPERAYYIRTDELKHMQPRGAKGRFTNKTRAQARRATDISLQKAVQREFNGQPALGICQPLNGGVGYQAGIGFDPDYFNDNMKHSVKGFTEWDIAENFLFGQHGNQDGMHFTEPHADIVLRDYINNYKVQFDRHYQDACKKFK